MTRPVVGITMGDPAGIGPEIVVKALANRRIRSLCRPLVFGSSRFLSQCLRRTGSALECRKVNRPSEASFEKNRLFVLEVETPGGISAGKASASSGKAALAYLDSAAKCVLRGEIDSIVTAPVSKAAVRLAGARSFVGHTEYLAEMTKARSFAMMFYSDRLKVSLVTTHLPLKDVASTITSRRILNVIILSNEALIKLGRPKPRIGVAGLNPHAGERKAFGEEDERVIAPAVRMARKRKISVEGPLPADTLFRAAYNGEYDIVVAMYHDQALAPFKMIAFEAGVNITLGLPFVRTSVDHGTAFDIAGKGIASEKSLLGAIKLAVKLSK